MNKIWYVYILASKRNGTLYVGVTSDIIKRIYQHQHKLIDWFSKKYNCNHLVYYEVFDSIVESIQREKQIKWKSRDFKVELIEENNPNWNDLYQEIV